MKNFKTLEVGKTYKNKKGTLVKIINNDRDDMYPFDGDNGYSYTIDGRRFNTTTSDSDLIELIEDKPTLAPNGQKVNPLTICEIDAKIAELQELRKELDKSVEVNKDSFGLLIDIRRFHEYTNKGFYLSEAYDWEITKDSENGLVLVPTKK